ncbi:hypothetical protein Dimus_001140 [Dionaea muscipula]
MEVGEALEVAGGCVVMEQRRESPLPTEGELPDQDASDGMVGPPTLKASEGVLHATVNVLPPHSTLLCDDVASFGRGKVSEEVPSAPVAREAVRSQPTDGLWQPPLAPVTLREGSMSTGGAPGGPVPVVIRSYAQTLLFTGFSRVASATTEPFSWSSLTQSSLVLPVVVFVARRRLSFVVAVLNAHFALALMDLLFH